jgi:hypothetical protein
MLNIWLLRAAVSVEMFVGTEVLNHAFILKKWFLRPLLKSNSAITDMSGFNRADSLLRVFAVFVRR